MRPTQSDRERVYRSEDGYRPADLLGYAVDHRNAALHLYQASFRYHDSAAYLGHCSVELCVKAVLLQLRGEYPGSHRLHDLFQLAAAAGRPLPAEASALVPAIDRAWDMRYPHPKHPKQVGHSDRDTLRHLWALLYQWVPAELATLYEDAEPHLKGGRVLMVRKVTDAPAAGQWKGDS